MASQNNREFVENWNLAHTLGEGAYGEYVMKYDYFTWFEVNICYFSFIRVKLLINRQSGEAVAMKMIDLEKHPDAKESVKKEVCIHKLLHHQHILKFFGKRTQGTIEYIFLEYAAGGELFDRIGKSVNFKFIHCF